MNKYDISIIIVNYNVEHFLDQCINSVLKSVGDKKAEIILVDNNSIDNSLETVSNKYPEVQIIANKENFGFSKANNQGIAMATGDIVLLLNPDTVIQEDTLSKVCDYFANNEDCGGLGVRMIDGQGNFLPESKRGLPTPKVAFYKIFGVSKLFPKSKKFGQYHMGHIDEHQTAETDVLSGAFMAIRKSVLNKIGDLDETFFMYGEDIDLSYRIILGGYKNIYFSDTSIIHYKGESTKKSSVNYVFIFYRAMVIFARKHFSKNGSWLFSSLINLAIYLRASIALMKRFFQTMTLPVIDFCYISIGLFALTNYWSKIHIEFPSELIKISIPVYALTWIASTYLQGGYDKPHRIYKFIKGVLIGSIVILVVYGILPKSMQFSRLFIFIGTAWVICHYIISRVFMHFLNKSKYNLKSSSKLKFAIVGSQDEFDRIKQLLSKVTTNIHSTLHYQNADEFSAKDDLDEVIFSSKDIAYEKIISTMSRMRNLDVRFKIAPENNDYLIGSNSIDSAGDLYILNLNRLGSKENKRKKRFFDFIFSSFFLILSPGLLFAFSNKSQFVTNLLKVLVGKQSFVGFTVESSIKDIRLPKIKRGILTPSDILKEKDESITGKLNLLYARDYSIRKDFSILFKSWRELDR